MPVLVFAENWEGKFKKATFEAITYANGVAQITGKSVIAISVGKIQEADLAGLGNYGVSKVLNVTDERISSNSIQALASVISEAAKKEAASVLIFAHTFTGQSVAPKVSAKLDAGYVAGVTKLPSALEPFKVKRKVFSGKAFADVEVRKKICVLTVFPNSHGIKETGGKATVEVLNVSVPEKDFSCKSIKVSKASTKLSVTEATIVVSAGRGLKGPENWKMIEELAGLLGAATACSKPVSDAGWRPHEEHVGQTGKTIGPNLYIAIGISGAIQHLAGVNSSKVIVVINKDPEAPFFKAADYGIVGDAFQIIPKLIESVKNFKEVTV